MKDRPSLGSRTDGPNLLGGETTHGVTVDLPATDTAADWSVQALTALGLGTRPWFDGGDVVLDLISPGRDLPTARDWDPLRAVGFHACAHPLRMPSTTPGDDPTEQAARLLDAVPDAGVGYLAARWSEDPDIRATMADLPRAELSFNYVGALLNTDTGRDDTTLFAVTDQLGPAGNEEADRYHLVAVVFEHDGEQGVFTWKYDPRAVDEDAVRSVAKETAAHFERLVRGPDKGGAATVGMSLAEVNTMLANLTRERNTEGPR
ncbi:hypothetical protein [Streptomyces sp. NPDC059894]|uniref:hypothetical protein n=1 Tax=unclassified Streptomyces TaxID=2593676 RepID=UPI003669DB16